MFNSLGGDDNEVQKWRKRGIYHYYEYLEQSGKYIDAIEKQRNKGKHTGEDFANALSGGQ